MIGYLACVALGAIGMLLLQATSVRFMDWWAEVVDAARDWVMSILGVCGVLFIICAIAYAAGWRS